MTIDTSIISVCLTIYMLSYYFNAFRYYAYQEKGVIKTSNNSIQSF
jgi:hypothetical protein